MDIILAVLGGLAVLFGAGNAVLIYTKPRDQWKTNEAAVSAVVSLPADESQFASSLVAVNRKIGLLNERLTQVETILAQIPLSALQERFDLAQLQEKVTRLTEFRREIKIQVVALRDAAQKHGWFEEANAVALEHQADEGARKAAELEAEIRARAFNSRRPRTAPDSK